MFGEKKPVGYLTWHVEPHAHFALVQRLVVGLPAQRHSRDQRVGKVLRKVQCSPRVAHLDGVYGHFGRLVIVLEEKMRGYDTVIAYAAAVLGGRHTVTTGREYFLKVFEIRIRVQM